MFYSLFSEIFFLKMKYIAQIRAIYKSFGQNLTVFPARAEENGERNGVLRFFACNDTRDKRNQTNRIEVHDEDG